jgi:hypothetical protein
MGWARSRSKANFEKKICEILELLVTAKKIRQTIFFQKELKKPRID